MNNDLTSMGVAAKQAARQLATLSTEEKNKALLAIAAELEKQSEMVLAQNSLDIADGRAKGLSEALLDRLLLTEERVTRLAADARRAGIRVLDVSNSGAGTPARSGSPVHSLIRRSRPVLAVSRSRSSSRRRAW